MNVRPENSASVEVERVAMALPGVGSSRAIKALCVFGTRPELIKFYPVLRELETRPEFELVSVLTSQHTDLITPLLDLWDIRIDHELDVMVPGQSLNSLVSRLLARLDDVLAAENPDVVLVQGDTASALAASMAAYHRQIPVAHIEAGLRSGMKNSPFPEEMNRRLITAIAGINFAPTTRNVDALRSEGVPEDTIFKTGNPIVDAVALIREECAPSQDIKTLLDGLAGQRIVLATTHRRESFGSVMRDRLRVLRRFVQDRPDVSLLLPVHPNPDVTTMVEQELGGVPRIQLLEPLRYPDFLHCLANAWLVVSDSGGVQEEAPSLGKPLLIIRPTTERPEVVDADIARLVGDDPDVLRRALEEVEAPGSWASKVRPVANPFGQGDSAKRIAEALLTVRDREAMALGAVLTEDGVR